MLHVAWPRAPDLHCCWGRGVTRSGIYRCQVKRKATWHCFLPRPFYLLQTSATFLLLRNISAPYLSGLTQNQILKKRRLLRKMKGRRWVERGSFKNDAGNHGSMLHNNESSFAGWRWTRVKKRFSIPCRLCGWVDWQWTLCSQEISGSDVSNEACETCARHAVRRGQGLAAYHRSLPVLL